MGIPAFAGANIEDGIAVVFYHVATVMKAKCRRVSGVQGAGKEDTEGVVTARTQLLLREAFILEKGEIFT